MGLSSIVAMNVSGVRAVYKGVVAADFKVIDIYGDSVGQIETQRNSQKSYTYGQIAF